MKTAAIICNIVLFGFICLVLLTDGPPVGPYYILFTFWSLFTLIVNSTLLLCKSPNAVLKTCGILCNILFLAFAFCAYWDQYPHPQEEGFIAFTVLMAVTPALNLAVLSRRRSADLLPN
jgi:hypothetical protein